VKLSLAPMRWSNVPVPEEHLGALIAGAGLHLLVPLRLPIGGAARWPLAASLVVGGAALAAWAVGSAGDADIERDAALVTDGAYAVTRNPMYLGWSAGVLGLALGSGSAWILASWAVAVTALDRAIRAEEARLGARFGETYAAYASRVPRYLPSFGAIRDTIGGR
jgi:protein-S-isoprenylcysteine O-methyltransferase Ste14